ncbi:MAG: LemA family protein [Candidatus Micrarchaeia archaeon]
MAGTGEGNPTGKFMLIGGVAFIALLVLICGAYLVAAYNGMVSADQDTQSQWGKVEVQYQRRVDLIPNMVEIARKQMDFEQSTLTAVTAARTGWLNAKTVDEKVAAGSQLDAAMPRFIATLEAYPQLRSSEINAKLMDEVAGTENRISVERSRYNDVVRAFNVKVKSFPDNMLAPAFGFKEKAYFQSAAGSDQPVKIKFD